MDKHKFYELSSECYQVLKQAQALTGLDLLRYKMLCDGSKLGVDCTYSAMTLKYFNQNREAEVQTLRALHTQLSTLLANLEES